MRPVAAHQGGSFNAVSDHDLPAFVRQAHISVDALRPRSAGNLTRMSQIWSAWLLDGDGAFPGRFVGARGRERRWS